jgi:predicted nuclease of restriction endonuclease-like (RecB) superfamily
MGGINRMPMTKKNKAEISDYRKWLEDIKKRIRAVQLKASVRLNSELIRFYWELGEEIVNKQALSKWGDGMLSDLSKDLMIEFPDMKGFSLTNLKYIRQWYLFFAGNSIGQQAVDQIQKSQQAVDRLSLIPWGHNIALTVNCKTVEEAIFYINNTIEYGWSRSVLLHHMETGLYKREGKAITNFSATLPAPESDLAKQIIKDPYVFDFITLSKKHNELDLEINLVNHITKFLVELGAGFAYVGRQVPVHVGKRDFYIDLLFYHLKLHCYVVIELKTTEFEPEYAGKLNFYIKAVDSILKSKEDKPTIGILICNGKDKTVVEYALSDISKPLGVAEYKLTDKLPKEFKTELPSIEEIEYEMERKITMVREAMAKYGKN